MKNTMLGSESAFPLNSVDAAAASYPFLEHGLTKRELFAAMAMQGAIAADSFHPHDIPGFAVEQADALLNALLKESPK
jgi:hypothetical protein